MGDRNTDEWHRLQWEQAEDEIGRQMLALFRDANALRKRFPALRRGGVSILHEVCKNLPHCLCQHATHWTGHCRMCGVHLVQRIQRANH